MEPLTGSCWRRWGRVAGARRPREGSHSQRRRGGRRKPGPGRVREARAGSVGAWLGAESSVLFQKESQPGRLRARKLWELVSLSPLVGNGRGGEGRPGSLGGLRLRALSRRVVLIGGVSGSMEVSKSPTSNVCPLSRSVGA